MALRIAWVGGPITLVALMACGQTTITSTHEITPRQGLSLQQDRIVDPNGALVSLHGFSWFGFNSQVTMVEGLGHSGVAVDFASTVHRQKLLGFNAVRLPFSFTDLNTLAPHDFTTDCTVPTDADVAASIVPPGGHPMSMVPPLPYPPEREYQECNNYLPNDTTFNRYVWVVTFYAHNGFYVLVDNHFREDQSVLADANSWAANWATLVQTLVADPVVRDHLLVDVLNEPDNYGVLWQASPGKPALADLYFKAMDAIHAVAPAQVFLLEGTGQGALQVNWGDGFCTDANLIKRYGLSDPRPFFNALASKPYANQVIISPHVYGPAVTTNTTDSSGAGLWSRLTNSFGSLTLQGYNNKVFPVAVGEFGSLFAEASDIATMTDLSAYLRNTGAANDGKHRAIDHWFYWDWNPTSGDTGGLVANDWLTLEWTKLQFLQDLGLGASSAGMLPSAPSILVQIGARGRDNVLR